MPPGPDAIARRVARLADGEQALLQVARRATLATIAPDGRPRLVPVCFVLVEGVVWTPIDEKPKAVDDPRRLARVRDIERDPRVTLLVDRWSEDWSALGWVRMDGHAELVETGDRAIIAALRTKYPQYDDHDLESRPMIRITVARAVAWEPPAALEAAEAEPNGVGEQR